MKRTLVIRHVPHEDLAGFAQPIEAAGYTIERIDVLDPAFAALDLTEPDLLVLMGGSMGVYQQGRHPWIGPELGRLAGRLELDRPTLGVCLGSQMVAAALGAGVRRGQRMEIGYSTLAILDPVLAPLEGVPVLHWHGDTFDLPPGAALLASTPLYPNQGFRRGANVLALQFHAEMGEDPQFETWVERGGRGIADAGTTPEALRADQARLGPPSLLAGREMLGRWLAALA